MSFVVLVEDDEAICSSLSSLLSKDGLIVKPYTSPLVMLEGDSWRGAEAVISDVSMPGMNGVELALTIRRKGFSGPFIFITALGAVRTEALGVELDPYLVVRKPFRAKDLMESLRLMIQSSTKRY